MLILDQKTLFRLSAGNAAAYATSFLIRKMCLIMCHGCEWLEKCSAVALAVSLMSREKKRVWWTKEVCRKLCFYCFPNLPRISISWLKIMKIEIHFSEMIHLPWFEEWLQNFYSSDLYPSSRRSLCCLERGFSLFIRKRFSIHFSSSSILDYINKQESFSNNFFSLLHSIEFHTE